MLEKGVPEHVRCDNGPEMIAKALREWLAGLGTRPLYIEPGSPWENGYCESFNGKLQDECLKREIFYSLREAQVVRSEEHTSELQSRQYLVCRLLLEKKNKNHLY